MSIAVTTVMINDDDCKYAAQKYRHGQAPIGNHVAARPALLLQPISFPIATCDGGMCPETGPNACELLHIVPVLYQPLLGM